MTGINRENSVKRSTAIIIGLLVSLNVIAETEILLKDGSRIRGEVQSMQNGFYQVRTESMGTIQLGSRQVQSITTVSAPLPGDSTDTSALSQSALDSITSSITNSPGMISTIMELQNDPQMKAVLADPDIMRAVHNLDLQALSNNPKIKALMDNAKIKRINKSMN